MKIVLVSDSHGNTQALAKLGKQFASKAGLFIHLGDDSSDAKILSEEGLRVLKVPGVFETFYTIPEIQVRKLCEYCGKKILITHTPHKHSNDLPGLASPEELVKNAKADIVLYGHTHIPKIETDISGVVWINPGHLKLGDDRGKPMSYAVLDLTEHKFEAKIYRFEDDSLWVGYSQGKNGQYNSL
ncbi:MAG: YfcE family phosphodiesterase [Elusimicrobiota bacterium]